MLAPTATVRIDSPVGVIAISATEDCLTGVRILARQHGSSRIEGHPLLVEAAGQMKAYFGGQLTAFSLPLIPCDSPQGHALRIAIASIPFGETRTYGALAQSCGSVARAVGQACKNNPYPIIIPCHRVKSASGPEFYSGGAGPSTKAWLNDFEHDHLPPERRTRLL